MERRLSNHTIYLLLLVAGFFDLIGAIPFLNIPIDILGWFTFWIWFIRLGIGWKSPRRLAAPSISALIELIPILSFIPTFLLAIGTNIAIITYEDYRKAIKNKDQKIDQKFTKLDKYYSAKQIVSRPPISKTLNSTTPDLPKKPTNKDNDYGIPDHDSNKNFQITDVKTKSSPDNKSPNSRAA